MKARSSRQDTVRIWDLPTRLFHIAFALVVVGAIVTAKIGQSWMDWHIRLGIMALALLIFRISWGLIGPRYARFSQFDCSPIKLWQYIKTSTRHTHKRPGHSPLGALSIIAMLTIISVQAVTGLFANDEILTQGPFAQFVSDAMSSFMTGVHQFNQKLVFAIIALHLSAIAVYTIKGESLIRPMVSGDVASQTITPNTIPARDNLKIRLTALALACPLVVGVWWLITLADRAGMSFN